MLKDNASEYPDSPALTMKMGFRTVTLTYKQAYDASRQVALLLNCEGVKKGDAVLLLAPNSPYWICTFWGCMLAGVVVVPLNVQSTPKLVEKIAKQVDAKLFFAHRYYRYDLPGEINRYDVDLLPEHLKSFKPDRFEALFVDENDLVEILYTSGTTGDPKGVLLTHKNLYSNVAAISKLVSLEFGKERLLSILPLSHIFEQAGMLLAFHYRAHTIYAHSHAAIRDLLQGYSVTKMLAVPEFLKILMGRIEGAFAERGKINLFKKLVRFSLKLPGKKISRLLFYMVHKKLGGKLDTIVSGGAPLDPELERKWNALGVALFQGYGLTETSPLIACNTYDDHRFGSVGRVVPGVQVRLSEQGEIQVRGPSVFSGYFKNKEKTKEAFTRDGWFRTGDVGEFDQNKFLFLKGRRKYMIVGPGGQNVFPEDIEEIINSFEVVLDCTVVGIEQASGMVEIHAVLLRPQGDVAAIIARANERLASYQQVTGFSVWPEEDFPRSATKKVKKDEVIRFLLSQKGENGVVTSGGNVAPVVLLLARVTGVASSRITPETSFAKLHIDSLLRVELIARIEEQFEILLDEAKLTSQTTVEQLEKMICERETVKALAPLSWWPRLWWARGIREVGQWLVFLLMRIFIKLQVKGIENLNGLSLPVVFMPNHLSYFDPMILVAALPRKVGRHVAFAAANDMLYGSYRWFAGFAELLLNAFPFPRREGENVKLGLDYMGRILDEDFSVGVFPEGKVSETGELLPLKKGAGLVAIEMRVPVVPVYIEGSQEVFPYFTLFPRKRGTVTVTFGKPIMFKPTESYVAATEQIEEALKELS